MTTWPLPWALEHIPQILRSMGGRPPGFFLDFDGTLAPVAPTPSQVELPIETREVLADVARRSLLCFVSGRGLEDLRDKIGIPTAAYVADHGHQIIGPPGSGIDFQIGAESRPSLEAAGADLRRRLVGVEGVVVEAKGLSLSVHYRLVAESRRPVVERAVAAVAEEHPDLRLASGKQVAELLPPGEWGKGAAVLWLITRFGLSSRDVCPVCLGDDLTDEGMFEAAEGWGVGIVVGDPQRPTRARYGLNDPTEVPVLLRALSP